MRYAGGAGRWRPRGVLCAAMVCALLGQSAPAATRSLDMIRARGALNLCAHPNSLPYASKTADPPGFQVELGRSLATELGVSLAMEWIVVPSQVFRADCDIVLDAIADPEAQTDTGLRLSKPYYSVGVALAVPRGSALTGFTALDGRTRVGVLVGSVAAWLLNQRHVPTSTFGFEEDVLGALAAGEIDAGAVNPVSVGYFNMIHPARPFTILPPGEAERALVWNEAVGMRQPDDKLREAIDEALDRLRADGSLDKIYGNYGFSLPPPR